MNIKWIALLIALSGLVFVATAQAEGLPWKNHQPPFDFFFGNHIDTHQQTMELPSGELLGYLYIEYTGTTTDEGIPIARHTDCNSDTAQCVVGWQWRGIQGDATFVYHEVGDHPLWLVSRDQIVQPGAFSHFHWLGDPELVPYREMPYPGYFIELKAVDTFAFEHGGDLIIVHPGIDIATHLNLVTVFPPLP